MVSFTSFYTAPSQGGGPAIGVAWNNVSRISEFKATANNKNVADPSSERIILEENHPALNHNGGTLAFGPDGYLYISIGDGGKDDVGAGHVNDWYAASLRSARTGNPACFSFVSSPRSTFTKARQLSCRRQHRYEV